MECVQLFLTDKVATVSPPVKQLKRFEKIQPGTGRKPDRAV
ncbi:MAG: fibronectin type III-like domain-contianing protein [Phaeodactylibacter sp.]|nr:fibronectin type III-like domain-contianing protein [Phaeodactylibacter sp.]